MHFFCKPPKLTPQIFFWPRGGGSGFGQLPLGQICRSFTPMVLPTTTVCHCKYNNICLCTRPLKSPLPAVDPLIPSSHRLRVCVVHNSHGRPHSSLIYTVVHIHSIVNYVADPLGRAQRNCVYAGRDNRNPSFASPPYACSSSSLSIVSINRLYPITCNSRHSAPLLGSIFLRAIQHHSQQTTTKKTPWNACVQVLAARSRQTSGVVLYWCINKLLNGMKKLED